MSSNSFNNTTNENPHIKGGVFDKSSTTSDGITPKNNRNSSGIDNDYYSNFLSQTEYIVENHPVGIENILQNSTIYSMFTKLSGSILSGFIERNWDWIVLTLTWERKESKVIFAILLSNLIITFFNLGLFYRITWTLATVPLNAAIIYALQYLISYNARRISKKRRLNFTYQNFVHEMHYLFIFGNYIFRVVLSMYIHSKFSFAIFSYFSVLHLVFFILYVPLEQIFWMTASISFLVPLIYFHKFDVTMAKSLLLSVDTLLGGKMAENIKEQLRLKKKRLLVATSPKKTE